MSESITIMMNGAELPKPDARTKTLSARFGEIVVLSDDVQKLAGVKVSGFRGGGNITICLGHDLSMQQMREITAAFSEKVSGQLTTALDGEDVLLMMAGGKFNDAFGRPASLMTV